MDVWVMDQPMLSSLLSIPEEMEKLLNAPTRTYVRDSKAMASTPADVKELPDSFVFVLDMPGLKSGDIKVQVEEGNVLSICGERKGDADGSGVRYLRMERRGNGKFMRKFALPKNANTDSVSAAYQDGVLTVTVPKVPPPEPKKPKTVEIKVA